MMTDLLNQLKPWLAWMHLHPGWVVLATFILALIECLAVIGLLLPGTVFMTVLGALIGSGIVPAKSVLVAAMAGSFSGDVVSFLIGYHYREHLREMWPFKFYPALLQKGEAFFYRHGGKGIFIGRFVGPIRPILPIIAGMLKMPPWRFLLADSISAILWAPLYMLPGILLGAASMELPPKVAMHVMLYVILALLILWCISWLIKRLVARVFNTLHEALDKLWRVIKHKPILRPLNIALQDPLYPESHAHLTLGLYFILFLGLFLFLAWDVLHQGIFTAWNTPLLLLLRSLHNTITSSIMLGITLFDDPRVWFGIFSVIFIWLLSIRAWRTAAHWLLLGLLGFGGAEIIKQIVHSPRPTGLLVTPREYSFPSGHTALSVVIGGFFAVLLSRELQKENRWIPYTIMAIVVLCVGSSRLYLGAHWLTDVVGGLFFGIAVVMFVALSYFRQAVPKIPVILFITVFISSWIMIGGYYSVKNYTKKTHDYTLYIPAKTLTMAEWWKNDGIDEPLYRANRLGRAVQAFNIQWAGNLEAIEENLLNQGWRMSPNTTVGMILDRLSQPKETIRLPVLTQLYLEQHPVLVMTKFSDSHLLVLRLWDGKTTFTNSGLPLWIGNIDYDKKGTDISPVAVFVKDLGAYRWKQLRYPSPWQKLSSKWDGQMVLIKPLEESA